MKYYLAQLLAFLFWNSMKTINFNIPKDDAIKIFKKSLVEKLIFKFFKS